MNSTVCRFSGMYVDYCDGTAFDGSHIPNSWMVCVKDNGYPLDYALLHGFGTKIDAIIAMEYMRSIDILSIMNLSDITQLEKYMQSHEKEWMEEVCDRLRW